MTNDQKAARLEEMAVSQDRLSVVLFPADSRKALTDAALLRECAAMMRERGPDDAMWEVQYERRYKRHDLCVYESRPGKWAWRVVYACCVVPSASGEADSLAAAQAAAVAWVDEQEEKDV